jgi:hypothetical protein
MANNWQHHHKLRATTFAVFAAHMVPVALHDGLHQRQTKAHAALALARAPDKR